MQEIDIAPEIGGVIVSVRVESGEDVEKGAPLFEIDNSVGAVVCLDGTMLTRYRLLAQAKHTR